MLLPEKRDLVGRAVLTCYFTLAAALQVKKIIAADDQSWLHLAAGIAVLGFLMLVVGTTLTRLPPVRSAQGWSPRLVALLGAFGAVSVATVPQMEVSQQLRDAADVIVIGGFSLCIWCLWWLGRSFSVMPQARRLVTRGPYRFVRHPLYVCETATLIGLILRNPAWMTFAIVAVTLVFQYLRILNEETVLRETFPEYDAYARQTPMLVPALR